MERQHTVKRVLIIALTFTVLIITIAGISAAKRARATDTATMQGVAPQNKFPIDKKRVLRGTESIKELAKQEHDLVAYQGLNNSAQYTDLNELASHSTAIIIGTAQHNSCQLSADEKRITIDYEVAVQDVIKGDLQKGRALTVSLPGGKVRFDDGTTAEVRAPWFKKMENGKTYVLFLDAGSDLGKFVTAGGPQGVFEMPADTNGVVKSNSGRGRDPIWKYHNTNSQAFLSQIRHEVKKESK